MPYRIPQFILTIASWANGVLSMVTKIFTILGDAIIAAIMRGGGSYKIHDECGQLVRTSDEHECPGSYA